MRSFDEPSRTTRTVIGDESDVEVHLKALRGTAKRAFMKGSNPLALLAIFAAAIGGLMMTHTIDAQEPSKLARVGVLTGRSPGDGLPFVDAFRQGMRDLGWIDGKNLTIDDRWAEGRSDRFDELAAELVRLKVDAILVGNTVAAVAAKNATNTIPIVMASVADPEGIGLVRSLARPGGNVTGLSYGVGTTVFSKQLEVLKETAPQIRRVAVLMNPQNRAHALWRKEVTAAPRLGVQLHFIEVRGPQDFDRAFAEIVREPQRVSSHWLTQHSSVTQHASRTSSRKYVCRACTAPGFRSKQAV